MVYQGPVRRWDVFRADLDFPVGSEQGGHRPVIVISNDAFNHVSPVVTIVPLTSFKEGRKAYPHEVTLPPGLLSEGITSVVLLQQVRTISKDRLLNAMGHIDDAALQYEMEDRLLDHLGIDLGPDNE